MSIFTKISEWFTTPIPVTAPTPADIIGEKGFGFDKAVSVVALIARLDKLEKDIKEIRFLMNKIGE